MNQQLTLSQELVNYMAIHLPVFKENEASKAINYIDQNFIVSDLGLKHFNNIIDAIEMIQDQNKKIGIQNLFTYWIQEKKCLIDCEFPGDSCDELKLALISEDKIYFNPVLNQAKRRKFSKEYNKLEMHDIKSFLNPEPYHRLKHLPTSIAFQKGIYYDLRKILNPFLKFSKTICIEDPYLPNLKASHNVLKVIENLKRANISLIFLNRSKYIDHHVDRERKKKEFFYDSFIEKLKLLITKGYQIKYNSHFKKKTHRERYIFTDEFQIYLPGGFDFLEIDGYLKNEIEFDIDDKKEIRIEERKFPI